MSVQPRARIGKGIRTGEGKHEKDEPSDAVGACCMISLPILTKAASMELGTKFTASKGRGRIH